MLTGVDVVLDAGLFGGIGERFADGDLVSPMGRVDKSTLRTAEQVVQKFAVLQAADVHGDVGQLRQLFGDDALQIFHLGANLPA